LNAKSRISNTEYAKIQKIYQAIQKGSTSPSSQDLASLYAEISILKNTIENKSENETIWRIFTSNLLHLGKGSSSHLAKQTIQNLHDSILTRQCENLLGPNAQEAIDAFVLHDTWEVTDFERALRRLDKQKAEQVCKKIQTQEADLLRMILRQKLAADSLETTIFLKDFSFCQQCLNEEDLQKISFLDNLNEVLSSLQEAVAACRLEQVLGYHSDDYSQILLKFRNLKALIGDIPPSYLPKEFMLEYCMFYATFNQRIPSFPEDAKLSLPDYAQSYVDLLEQEANAADIASQIQTLFPETNLQLPALAHFVNTKQIALTDLFPQNSKLQQQILLRLASYLTVVDLNAHSQSFTNQFREELLSKCNPTKIQILLIAGSNITRLPDLPACLYLDCSSSSLRNLNIDLGSCFKLDCHSCPLMQRIPRMVNCFDLDCHDCPLLQELPIINPSYVNLRCDNRLLITSGILRVDIDELETSPQKYLESLGERYLLQGHPFPRITYRKDGKALEAVDAGGVTRDFLSKLFEALKQGKLLTLLENSNTGVWPQVDENEIGIRTLGRLLVFCWNSSLDCKMGQVLDRNLLAILKIPDIENQSEEALVTAYLLLKGFSQEASDAVLGKKPLDQLPEKMQTHLSYLIEDEEQKDLKTVVLAEAKKDKRLMAASIIAQGVPPASLREL
jgi:hypothetical protein